MMVSQIENLWHKKLRQFYENKKFNFDFQFHWYDNIDNNLIQINKNV